MATRFYTIGNIAGVSPAFDGVWDETAEATRTKLSLLPSGYYSGAISDTDTIAAAGYYLLQQFISEPLDAISATLPVAKAAFRCYESNAKLNGFTHIVFRKCDEDGGNPVTIGSITDDTEWDDGEFVNRFVGASNLTDQALNQGDRLVIEVGFYSSATKAGGFTGSLYVSDSYLTLIDSCPSSEFAYSEAVFSGRIMTQSFIGDGNYLSHARFYLSKRGTITGNAYAAIWEHSGTYGSTGVPTGDPLAVSQPFNVSGLSTGKSLKLFYFDSTFQLVNTTPYFVGVYYDDGDIDNAILNSRADNISVHGGNRAGLASGSWTAYIQDALFYVYTSVGSGLPENDTETAAYNSWIETGDTFTEATAGGGALSINVSDGLTAAQGLD